MQLKCTQIMMQADALFTFAVRRQPRHLLLSVLINTITAISNLDVWLQSRVKQESYNIPATADNKITADYAALSKVQHSVVFPN